MIKKQYSKTSPNCKVTFVLPLDAFPGEGEIRVLGEFNDWNWEQGLPMKPGKTEYKAALELETGRSYEFRYLVDGRHWFNDSHADAYSPTRFGVENCIIILDLQQLKTEKPSGEAAEPIEVERSLSQAENLKKIEGIGPKIEQILNDSGILTFSDLATSKVAELKKILDKAGNRYKKHDPSTWPKQAKLAAAGKWEELAEWQKELKGGKEIQ